MGCGRKISKRFLRKRQLFPARFVPPLVVLGDGEERMGHGAEDVDTPLERVMEYIVRLAESSLPKQPVPQN